MQPNYSTAGVAVELTHALIIWGQWHVAEGEEGRGGYVQLSTEVKGGLEERFFPS